MGMIASAVEADELMEAATNMAKTFAAGPTIGLALTKHAIQNAATNNLDEQLDMERDMQRRAGKTPDYAEGVRAFIGKRVPNFSGKE